MLFQTLSGQSSDYCWLGHKLLLYVVSSMENSQIELGWWPKGHVLTSQQEGCKAACGPEVALSAILLCFVCERQFQGLSQRACTVGASAFSGQLRIDIVCSCPPLGTSVFCNTGQSHHKRQKASADYISEVCVYRAERKYVCRKLSIYAWTEVSQS